MKPMAGTTEGICGVSDLTLGGYAYAFVAGYTLGFAVASLVGLYIPSSPISLGSLTAFAATAPRRLPRFRTRSRYFLGLFLALTISGLLLEAGWPFHADLTRVGVVADVLVVALAIGVVEGLMFLGRCLVTPGPS